MKAVAFFIGYSSLVIFGIPALFFSAMCSLGIKLAEWVASE